MSVEAFVMMGNMMFPCFLISSIHFYLIAIVIPFPATDGQVCLIFATLAKCYAQSYAFEEPFTNEGQ